MTTLPDHDEVDVSTPESPWPVAGLIGAVLLLAATNVLAAVLAATLTPLRAGTIVIPLAVLIAVASNVVLPAMAMRCTGSVISAGVVVGVWVVAVLVLSQSRGEGDVILLGGTSGVTYVVYATMIGGLVAGLVTVVRLGRRTMPARPMPAVRPQPKR